MQRDAGKRALRHLVVALGLFTSACAADMKKAEPSFDCEKASTSAEYKICSSPKLAAADMQLSKAYNDYRRSIKDDPIKLSEALIFQRFWLRNRANYCPDADESCLLSFYDLRIRELRRYEKGEEVLEVPSPFSENWSSARVSEFKRLILDQRIGDEAYKKTIFRVCKTIQQNEKGASVVDSIHLMMCYVRGVGIEKDPVRALNIAQSLTLRAKPKSWPHDFVHVYLGKVYADGFGVPQKPSVALAYFRAVSPEKLACCLSQVVRAYLSVNKPDDAIDFLKVHRNIISANLEIANIYLWLARKASLDGSANEPKLIAAAATHLVKYFNSWETEKSRKDLKDPRIRRLLIQRAEFLSNLYKPTTRGPGDPLKFVKYNLIAAELGSETAQVQQAVFFGKGVGVDLDVQQSLNWFLAAARQGNKYAQKSAGMLMALGRGVPQDFVQAYVWLNIAAANGEAGSAGMRDELADMMTKEDISKAQSLSKQCISSKYKECN